MGISNCFHSHCNFDWSLTNGCSLLVSPSIFLGYGWTITLLSIYVLNPKNWPIFTVILICYWILSILLLLDQFGLFHPTFFPQSKVSVMLYTCTKLLFGARIFSSCFSPIHHTDTTKFPMDNSNNSIVHPYPRCQTLVYFDSSCTYMLLYSSFATPVWSFSSPNSTLPKSKVSVLLYTC